VLESVYNRERANLSYIYILNTPGLRMTFPVAYGAVFPRCLSGCPWSSHWFSRTRRVTCMYMYMRHSRGGVLQQIGSGPPTGICSPTSRSWVLFLGCGAGTWHILTHLGCIFCYPSLLFDHLGQCGFCLASSLLDLGPTWACLRAPDPSKICRFLR
jgi:hypothetical protein